MCPYVVLCVPSPTTGACPDGLFKNSGGSFHVFNFLFKPHLYADPEAIPIRPLFTTLVIVMVNVVIGLMFDNTSLMFTACAHLPPPRTPLLFISLASRA